jgi:SsrA-binding protein
VVAPKDDSPTVKNKKAGHLYLIEERLEAGIMLRGTEVKAIRTGKCNLTDSHVRVKRGELYLVGCHIGAYEAAAPQFNHEPRRERKLLVHRRELDRFLGKIKVRGYTLIVTKIYFKEGRAKAELSLCKGKKAHDKRSALRERQVKKEMDRAIKAHR